MISAMNGKESKAARSKITEEEISKARKRLEEV